MLSILVICRGRNPRETGPKGATLVEVVDGEIVGCTHRDLDEVRWASDTLDVTDAVTRQDVLSTLQSGAAVAAMAAKGRPVALRLRLEGATPLHHDLLLHAPSLREDVEAMLATSSTEIWLEQLQVATRSPATPESIDPTIAGHLEAEVRRLAKEAEATALLEACLAELKVKMPAGARVDALFERIRREAPARATDLALSLVAEAEPPRAL